MRRRRPARDLRIAIDCLPVQTRHAMLAGVEANRIIVGAYTDRKGGVCPMLAAHRNGGRTSLASFAHAWDRYTKARGKPRPATDRELNTLRAMLEASIMVEETPVVPTAEPTRQRRDTGERHRGAELKYQPGWAWMRPFRRLDEFERAVAQIEHAERVASEAKASEAELERA